MQDAIVEEEDYDEYGQELEFEDSEDSAAEEEEVKEGDEAEDGGPEEDNEDDDEDDDDNVMSRGFKLETIIKSNLESKKKKVEKKQGSDGEGDGADNADG